MPESPRVAVPASLPMPTTSRRAPAMSRRKPSVLPETTTTTSSRARTIYPLARYARLAAAVCRALPAVFSGPCQACRCGLQRAPPSRPAAAYRCRGLVLTSRARARHNQTPARDRAHPCHPSGTRPSPSRRLGRTATTPERCSVTALGALMPLRPGVPQQHGASRCPFPGQAVLCDPVGLSGIALFLCWLPFALARLDGAI